MSVLPILIYGDARLRKMAEPVAAITPEIRALAKDMSETMYAAPGRGLAAPQVGHSLRLFVMDCHWRDGAEQAPVVMLNPEIIARYEAMQSYDEGCLSIPDVLAAIKRPAEATLRWQDLDGGWNSQTFAGIEAICVQHEYDHLDGVLIVDHMTPEARSLIEPALPA